VGTPFNDNLKTYFRCNDGAYSVVTGRESEVDSQITATGHEKEILVSQIGDILRGSVKGLLNSGVDPEKRFKLYPTGKDISLNLVFPKPKKGELRLYLRTEIFRPDPNYIWFVFVKDDEIWLGALEPVTFEGIRCGTNSISTKPALLDIYDAEFQEALYLPESSPAYETTIKRIKRKPSIAKNALKKSEYKCELDPDFPVFLSRVDGKTYLEAHHFIPLSEQPFYSVSLDVIENIVILNPTAHRMLHYGLFKDIKRFVEKMAARRTALIRTLKITKKEIEKIYGG
jgi:5-methylcytosine-specific restriction enzyme A